MKRLLLLLCLWPALVFGQISAPTTTAIQEEGAAQGRVRTLNCVGSNITCTVAGPIGTVTIPTIPIGGGGTGSTAFTAGSVIFSNGTILTQDNANLFWNDANNRLGIGTNVPGQALDVSFGSVSLVSARVRNTTNGVGSIVGIALGNDVNALLGGFFGFASGYTSSGADYANGIQLLGQEIGGITIFSSHVSGPVRIATNGSVTEMVHIARNVGIGTSTLPATGTFGLVFGDETALASMGSNTAGFYANDVSGTVNMYAISEAGSVAPITTSLHGGAPAVGGSCGVGPSRVGTNTAGKVTAGTGVPTSCTITFDTAHAFQAAPACVVSNETTANLARATSTLTAVVLTGTFVAGDVLAYICLGY